MYISMYEDAFRKAFSDCLDDLEKEPFEATVKGVVSKICEEVVDRVHDDVRDRLIQAIGDSVCAKAAEVATRMIEDALSGDDKEIKNLFGFYAHDRVYNYNNFFGYSDQRWKLVEGLMTRRPDVFIDERIYQLNGQVVVLEKQAKELLRQINWWRDKAEGREPESQT